MRRPLRSPCWALLLLLVGCGAESRTLEDSEAVRDACQDLASTLCARRWECIPLAFEYGYGFGDAFRSEEVCVERTLLACEGWTRLPGIGTDEAAFRQCAAQIGELPCRTSTHTLTYPTGNCEALRGSLEGGAPCEIDLQCESGDCERSGGERACADTVAEPPPRVGDPCGTRRCGDDLVCLGDECVEPALEGEACGDTLPACAEYAEITCEEGTCVPRPTSGGACGRSLETGDLVGCTSGDCRCCNDRGAGLCVDYLQDGEACDRFSGPLCLYPARCVDDRCSVPGG